MKPKPEKVKFSPRIRFNWGYHDGAHAPFYLHQHFDKFYLKGHNEGFEDAKRGDYHGDSREAWKRFRK